VDRRDTANGAPTATQLVQYLSEVLHPTAKSRRQTLCAAGIGFLWSGTTSPTDRNS
jgi:hypothetical protein